MDSQDTHNSQETFQTALKEDHITESPTKNSSSRIKNSHEDSTKLVSLLNFNPRSPSKRFLNSPRSVEAMKRLCFEDHELLQKGKEDFVGMPVPAEFADDKAYFYECKAEHYEKRRQEKLKLAIQERQEIINTEEKHNHSTAGSHQGSPGMDTEKAMNSTLNSTNFFGQERKKIQQMKNQQKKEIDLIIQNELRVQEMLRKNEEKVQRMLELEEKRQSIVEEKQRLAEEAKRKRELQKLEKEREDELQKEVLLAKHKEEEAKRAAVQERLKEERAVEALLKEKERKEKSVVREKRIEEIEVTKKVDTEKKMVERDQRFARIKIEIEEKQKRKQIQSEVARRNFDIKIEVVRKKFEFEKEDQRKRVLEKQKITISRREKMEEEKQRTLDERRNRSEIKIREIRCSLDEKFLNEQAKKMAYLVKLQKAEENKKQKDFELEQERKLKAQREAEKEERARHLVTEYDQEKNVRSSNLLKTLNEKSVEAQIRKETNIKNLKKKYIMDILKMEDAYENTKRLEKIRETKTKAFMEKITSNAERLQKIQLEKERMIKEKKKLQTQLEIEKEMVLKDFEKKKKLLAGTKTNLADLSVDLKGDNQLMQTAYGTNNFSTKQNERYPVLGEIKSASRSAKNVRGNNLSSILHNKPAGHEPNSASLSISNNSGIPTRNQHISSASPQMAAKKRGSVGRDAIIKVKNDVLKKNDILPAEIQNQEYNKESAQFRETQLTDFLKALDNAVKTDKDEKKVDSHTRDFITIAQKEEEELNKIRTKNNFLLLA